MLSGRCLERGALFSFQIGEEMFRGVGQGLVPSGVRESPMEVRLVHYFEFFGLFFVLVFVD